MPVNALINGRANSVPRTEAASTTSRSCSPTRSTRARAMRSRAAGTGTSAPAGPPKDHSPRSLTNAPVSRSNKKRSSRNRGLPSTPSRTASTTAAGASPSRDATRVRSAGSGRGESSIFRNGQGAPPDSRKLSRSDTPGSGSGRLVTSTSSGPAAASATSCSVSRTDVGSAQWRSSRARTVGPTAASRPTTARRALRLQR